MADNSALISTGLTAAGTAVGGPAGGAVGGAIGKAVSSQGSSSLCGACCGNESKAADQKKAINDAHPLTGDPAVDAQIQAQRDKEFKDWQHMQDVTQFEQLPAETKKILPAFKGMVDQIYAKLPEADRKLTLAQLKEKYPQMMEAAWAEVQKSFPALAGMPLDYAMGLAKASGADQLTVADIKDRLDYVATNAPSAKAIMGGGVSVGTVALAGVGGLVGMIAIVKLVQKLRQKKK